MADSILFATVFIAAIVIFCLLKWGIRRKYGQPSQNYDDKIDRLVEQLDNF